MRTPLTDAKDTTELLDTTANERVKMLVAHVEAIQGSVDHRTPRYYLFEYFLETASGYINNLSENETEAMEEKVFIPKDIGVAPDFHRIVAAYSVMKSAFSIIEVSPLLPEHSNEAKENLEALDKAMKNYEIAINELIASGHPSVTKEAREKIDARETRDLIHYLARRIEAHYETVIPELKTRKRARIKKLVDYLLDTEKVSGKSPDVFYKGLGELLGKNRRIWRRGLRAMRRTILPDDGSIDGMESAFDSVYSVQFSSVMIKNIGEKLL